MGASMTWRVPQFHGGKGLVVGINIAFSMAVRSPRMLRGAQTQRCRRHLMGAANRWVLWTVGAVPVGGTAVSLMEGGEPGLATPAEWSVSGDREVDFGRSRRFVDVRPVVSSDGTGMVWKAQVKDEPAPLGPGEAYPAPLPNLGEYVYDTRDAGLRMDRQGRLIVRLVNDEYVVNDAGYFLDPKGRLDWEALRGERDGFRIKILDPLKVDPSVPPDVRRKLELLSRRISDAGVKQALQFAARQPNSPGGEGVTTVEEAVVRVLAEGARERILCEPWACARALLAAHAGDPLPQDEPHSVRLLRDTTWNRQFRGLLTQLRKLENPNHRVDSLTVAAIAKTITSTRHLLQRWPHQNAPPPVLRRMEARLRDMETIAAARIYAAEAREALAVLFFDTSLDEERAKAMIAYLSPFLERRRPPATSDEL